MGLAGSLVVVAAVLAAVCASSLSGIPLCPGTHMRIVGPDRALRSDLRWWVLLLFIHFHSQSKKGTLAKDIRERYIFA